MSSVFFTKEVPLIAREIIEKAGHTVMVGTTKGVLTKKQIIKILKKRNYDAVLALLTDTIDEEVLDTMADSGVKVIANYAVGFNNINIKEANKRGITVTNTPGVLTEAVAEHTVAFMLACASRVVEGDMFIRAKMFKQWEPLLLLGVTLKERTLGIAGAGRIGTRVAEIAHKGLNMNIAYYDIQKNKYLEKECGATFYESLDECIRQSNVLSVHLPLNDQTRGILNRERLSLLQSGTIFVNTSRGAVVDEDALADLLENGHIRAAALDVFENEPKVNPKLRKLSNTVLTPHIASASETARNAMATLAAKILLLFLTAGKRKHRLLCNI